jgi:heme A synthase
MNRMTTAIERLDGPRGIALPRVAALCTALMFVVVAASAFLRHHADQAAWASELVVARQVHRVAATLVLLGAVAMVWLARRAQDRAALRLASALLGVALLLSAVGIAAGASRAAPVVLVNLLGGFVMLALCARLAMPLQRESTGRAAAIMLALVALQAAAGALASATASPDCVGLTGCEWAALVHRFSGVALAFALIVFGLWAASSLRRRSGTVLAVIGMLLFLLGTLAAGLGSTAVPLLIVMHNALGAAVVVGLVRLV